LIQRIYQHCAAEGWLAPGATVLDCFAGTGLGGLDAGLAGYRFIGVELEPRFCAIFHGFDCDGSAAKHEACSQQGDHAAHHVTGNLELWQRRYGHLPQWVAPTLVQGDSRRLGDVLREADCCISSPPYAASFRGQSETAPRTELEQRFPRWHTGGHSQLDTPRGYGTTEGQLGALPPGSLDAAISSPPHVRGLGKEHTYADPAKRDRDSHRAIMREKGIADPYYGRAPAQLGNLPAGTVEAVVDGLVSSPPYEGSRIADIRHLHFDEQRRDSHWGKVQLIDKDGLVGYGEESPGQLGTEHGTTFWSAAREIVAQVVALLKPNGIAVWVVKSYVRDGQIVDFPGQWRTLCESLGLVTLHEHHALLVEEHGTQGGLFGEDTTHRTERKSFFRRLHEKKRPDLAIDYEVVLCMQKREGTTTAGSVEVCCSSPPYNLPMSQDHNGSRGGARGTTPSEQGAFVKYGSTPGQLEGMPPGSLDLCLSSPPYAASWHASESIDVSEDRMRKAGYSESYIRESVRFSRGRGGNANAQHYGQTEGQLGAMPAGTPPASGGTACDEA
jgi:hypothetical protein